MLIKKMLRCLLTASAALAVCFAVALHAGTADSVSSAQRPSSFHFTVTSDLHNVTDIYDRVLDAMQIHSKGQGAFQISVGDLADKDGQTPQCLRDLIDSHWGSASVWWPVVGNHDSHAPSSMTWIRAEYETGNGARRPLKNLVTRAGPTGSAATTYSWDYRNVHFIVLNEYWNGETVPGSDVAIDGDVVPALREWLEDDLTADQQPFIFVFGHAPAFPEYRHIGNSLDINPANRDAFWQVLQEYHVQAFISGHIHFYYKQPRDGVYQIVDGCAGRSNDQQTYLDVVVGQEQAQIRVWQNNARGGSDWRLVDTIMLAATARPGTHSVAVGYGPIFAPRVNTGCDPTNCIITAPATKLNPEIW